MRAEIQEDVQILELPGRPLHDELLQRGHAEIHPRLGQRVWRQQCNSKEDAAAEASRGKPSRGKPSRARRVTHLVLAVPPDHLQGRLGYDGSLQDQLGEKPGGAKTRPRV